MKLNFAHIFCYSPSEEKGMNMFYGASNVIFQRAQELRNTMTPAEEILWQALHINEWKLKFRRQHPVANYVVDFYCHPIKLIIELDGGIQQVDEVKRNDGYREQHFKELGLNLLRFKNEEVFNNRKTVLETIQQTINRLTSSPLGDGGKKKLFVIKIGGNTIDDENELRLFLTDFALISSPLQGTGVKTILVHGGGKIATSIGNKLGINSKYINGRRITDDETIDLVTMVYGGLINKKIVAQLQTLGCNALGLTGADGNLIPATKRPVRGIDYGWAGDVASSRVPVAGWQLLLENNFVPVVAPLTHDERGHILNTNADTISSSLAVALSALYDVRLIYCFEKKGVLENMEDENSVIHTIDKIKYQHLMSEKKLSDGILPKIENAFAAIDAGVQEVLIGDANDLIQNTTQNISGTLIVADEALNQ